MTFNSPFPLKRRRLTSFDSMDADTVKAMLASAKEKYGRECRVFETLRTSEPPAETTDTQESEDFYDFTAEDYYRLLATKKEDKYLKTRKIREAEEAARRAKMTKSIIRVRFPDNHTLEARFHPSETTQSLVDFLRKVLARPELPFYIYTTPPKKQLKDMSEDFYSAGFVPGAIVYFSYDLPKDDEAHSGPFLVEDVISLKGLDHNISESAESANPLPEPKTRNESPPPAQPEHKPADKKASKPKWLKL